MLPSLLPVDSGQIHLQTLCAIVRDSTFNVAIAPSVPLTPEPDAIVSAVPNHLSASRQAVSTQANDLLPSISTSRDDWRIGITPAGVDSAPRQQPNVNFTLDVTFGTLVDQGFGFGFGAAFASPTALQGPNRTFTTNAQSPTDGLFPIPFYIEQKINMNQRLAVEFTVDPEDAGIDAAYSIKPAFLPGFFSFNGSNSRSLVTVFDEGRREGRLPRDQKPWVHRLGGGVEYFQPFTIDLGAALGVNYQRVSVRNRMFTSKLSPFDEFGNLLTAANRGQDDLLTLNLAAYYRNVDNPAYATRGSKVRLGLDQAIPVGDASITYTRISANATQFIPLNLFGFGAGARTLVLNVQGGVMLGDVPAYEAFTLGGGDTVRSYAAGAVGSGSRFVQASAEYRFPLFNFSVIGRAIQTRGVFFVDYGNVLDSERNVLGNPSRIRLKPGDGLAYGGGLHFVTPFGLLRLEVGLNDRGGYQVVFNIGDRF